MTDFLQRYIQENKKLLKTEQYVTPDDMTADDEVDVARPLTSTKTLS